MHVRTYVCMLYGCNVCMYGSIGLCVYAFCGVCVCACVCLCLSSVHVYMHRCLQYICISASLWLLHVYIRLYISTPIHIRMYSFLCGTHRHNTQRHTLSFSVCHVYDSPHKHTHTHTQKKTHTHTHTKPHIHTHTHARAHKNTHTYTQGCLSFILLLSCSKVSHLHKEFGAGELFARISTTFLLGEDIYRHASVGPLLGALVRNSISFRSSDCTYE
jgi:hypothetical protein